MQRKGFYLMLLLTTLMNPVSQLHAQPDDAQQEQGQDQDQEQEPGEAEQNEQQPGEDDQQAAQTDLPDIDSQPIDASASPGPGRFIPSEQISQDSGVSFPVDI